MMDKKSANGFQTKASEGGIQRKQLPYSVETPYGFHLDLDFLKYVDDIEKGNTIKRVHIQRRVKGPPKFSTLPRNFSLPGHGARPAPKEKDSTWSGTSTLGPKPKSRVTEVQQIFDFRASEGGTSTQSSRGTTGGVAGYVSAKPREEVGAGARDVEDKTAENQSRPNLLRASSMPITLQQRKGSDSSSPDRVVGTPESGSTENVFRASPDITERRCVPQDRTGLHQQITVALKRVRELEEQVKTIPELKAQICSLREEREKLLLQLQAQAQAQVSTSSPTIVPNSDSGPRAQPQGHRPTEGLNLALMTHPTGGLEASERMPAKPETGKGRQSVTEKSKVSQKESSSAHGEVGGLSDQESERQTQPSEISDKQKETLDSPLEHAVKKLSQDIAGQELTSLRMAIKDAETSSIQDGDAAKGGKLEDPDSMQNLQEKLMTLEAKLTQAKQDLERTNALLKEQINENKVKEEKILQLSDGIRVEICSPEAHSRPRRESIDTGTETEKVDFTNQETETESPGTVDQGTDTDRICIEVCVPKPRAGSIDQVTETNKVDTHEQVTEAAAVSPPRPRANSMERGTVTERIATQDQMTETPVAERVNQVTETEGETITDHPQRPRASSVERGTVTERVDTVDRVTETLEAQRTDQQTETEVERRHDNNPARGAEAESQVRESAGSERVEGVGTVVSESVEDKEENERIQRDSEESESVKVVTESMITVLESRADQTVVSDIVSQDEGRTSPLVAAGESTEPKIEMVTAQKGSETKEIEPPKSEIVETQQIALETVEKKQTAEGETVCAAIKETVVTDTVVVTAAAAAAAAENAAVKTVAPVRPQRGRKLSADQAQPSPSQLQTAPVRPRRGSSETQAKESQPQTKTQPQVQVQGSPVPAPAPVEAQTPTHLSEPQIKQQAPSPAQVEDRTSAKRPPGESGEKQPQTATQGPPPGSKEVQVRPKSIQAQSRSQTAATRRDSKEGKAPQRGSSVSQPPSRGSAEAQTRPTRQGACDTQPQSQGSRRSSSETQPPHKDASETQSLRRGSSETAQRRGSSEAQASRKDAGEAQPPRRGSSESPTSPAALGQVVTRLTGLLGEQWAQLGSSSGTQQTVSQQESPNTQKQTAGKRAEAGKGASAKPAGKAVPAAATGKPAGKPGPSKMSTIQSQLVSSLSVLSAFYSPGQKAAAASKQQEQGLKSIMKKNGVADKQGNKGAKKNLKFVGVNGGYETTSSEESSGDEKSKVEVEEEDSSEPEVEKEKKTEPQPAEKPEEGAESQQKDAEVATEGGGAVAAEKESERGLLDPEGPQELLEEQAEGEKVDQGFIDACIYVKDRMEEVSSPDKEMRQVLVVLYQEWFKISSQKNSQADTVRLYLRQVGLTTPTLLPYVVNLTDGNGNMALHYSVSHSNFPVVKLLLDTGLCETDNVNKAGYTPVMLAALTAAESPDDLEVAQQLLRLGDVNACSRQAGQTALMLAVSHGRVAMVKLLLSCGADVNAQDREGSTALMCASEHGHTNIVRMLLETGRCDSSLTDKNGQTALLVAEAAPHQEIVDLLKAHAESKASEPSSTADLL
ncbi:KN motif and ankyrin repeat domain-containing protein 4 [Epinephelus fuscoguttatus]|uniref:KN motif and ankyrin repeat domain-containing protein 4 n=1 Tax=Epinephelus fuscoguttatus TaxID=293821 RepID=UPI0020D0EB4B|nr:KN motif and ankyrin repeat domain-containing protein 4 [Epinephelus fuscoguttatus]XP_049443494.1 KN motif and ankyrin repeat domain-containing protein 4 [Epinephelus fuscoguttatus]XP_049443495.1 KN motif and ankyrin repeat domain-containing protein 4 [Epinephelus fuscoguttatus]XP_049443496.1 KN motif and ankyrin repeat domain-containing protein 4 [Epinephelus fuscoguttatus]